MGDIMKMTLSPITVIVVWISVAPFAMSASFTVSGPDSTAKTLSGGETGTVTATGDLAVGGSTVAVTLSDNTNTPIVINNAGQIRQTGNGFAIANPGTTVTANITINNLAGALIESNDRITIQAPVSRQTLPTYVLNNSGTIFSRNASRPTGGSIPTAVNLGGTSSATVNNYATGVIRANYANAVVVGAGDTVYNEGLIQALADIRGAVGARQAAGGDGITFSGTGVQITNSGTISGRHGVLSSSAYALTTITNGVGGVIEGTSGSGLRIAADRSDQNGYSYSTIVNRGTITGKVDNTQADLGEGIGVFAAQRVILDNYGSIQGLGSLGAGASTVGLKAAGGTIVNYAGAEIIGRNDAGSAPAHGIVLAGSPSPVSITNSGLIRGYSGYGIQGAASATTIVNEASGIIRGGAGTGAALYSGAGSDTVTNRGTIIGDNGKAIDLGAFNDTLIVEGGAAQIIGDISGGHGTSFDGVDSLLLRPGAGNTFEYAGSISDFETVDVQSGTVRLTGANTYVGKTKVSGRLELIGVSRIAGGSALEMSGGYLKISEAYPGGQTFASLTLSDNSIIDVDGSNNPIFFGLGSVSLGKTLSVVNYESEPGYEFALRFMGDLTHNSDFLALLAATTVNGQAAEYLLRDGGQYTDIGLFQPIPEPGTAIFGLLLTGLAVGGRRRRGGAGGWGE